MNRVIFLQKVIYIISTLGILMGIDLLMGAKITDNLNKTLDKTVLDFDKIVANFRKTVDSRINIDKKIIHTKTRMILGFLFIVICAGLIYAARRG